MREVTHFVLTAPCKKIYVPLVGNSLLDKVICIFGPTKNLVVGRDKV